MQLSDLDLPTNAQYYGARENKESEWDEWEVTLSRAVHEYLKKDHDLASFEVAAFIERHPKAIIAGPVKVIAEMIVRKYEQS